jgi:hypothetical protein
MDGQKASQGEEQKKVAEPLSRQLKWQLGSARVAASSQLWLWLEPTFSQSQSI